VLLVELPVELRAANVVLLDTALAATLEVEVVAAGAVPNSPVEKKPKNPPSLVTVDDVELELDEVVSELEVVDGAVGNAELLLELPGTLKVCAGGL